MTHGTKAHSENKKEEISRNPEPADEIRFLEETPETQKAKLNNKSLKQDIEERKKYANRAYKITFNWIILLGVVILLQIYFRKNGLTENEFITVITSTTASIFGFWYLVMNYLFPKPAKEKK